VIFHQNIGLVIFRVSRVFEGDLCKPCIHSYFWKFTLITLFFGWWSIISLFVAPFFLVFNTIVYLTSLVTPGGSSGATKSKRDQSLPTCVYCGQIDPDLPRRGYCLKCDNDV
jgi:hypothetical protein